MSSAEENHQPSSCSVLLPGGSSLAGGREYMAALLATGLEDRATTLGQLAGAESRSPSPLPE